MAVRPNLAVSRADRVPAALTDRGVLGLAGLRRSGPTFEERYELADAVAFSAEKPAYLLDSANKSLRGGCRIGIRVAIEAVEAGTAATYAVEVAGDVLALDADSLQQSAWLREALAPELRALGFNPVLVASGRPDHLHLFCRLDSSQRVTDFGALVFALPREQRPDWRKLKEGIRPPGAPHREGLPVALVSPSSWAEALDYLIDGRSVTRPRTDAEPGEVLKFMLDSLSPNCRDALEAPVAEKQYPTRSERLRAVLVGFGNAAYAADLLGRLPDLTPLLLPLLLSLPGGSKLTDEDPKGAEKRLRRELVRVVKFVRSYPPERQEEKTQGIIGRVFADAMAKPWGRSSATDRAVLQAVLNLAAAAGKTELHASERVLAARAGVARATAGRSLRRLAEAGWLKKMKSRRYESAAVWAILDRPDARAVTVPMACAVADIWRRGGGLGPVAGRIWGALGAEAQSVAAVALAVGRDRLRDRPNIRRQLARLAQLGLAQLGADGWSVGAVSPIDAAAGRRCEGAAARQALDFAHERGKHAEVCAIWKQAAAAEAAARTPTAEYDEWVEAEAAAPDAEYDEWVEAPRRPVRCDLGRRGASAGLAAIVAAPRSRAMG